MTTDTHPDVLLVREAYAKAFLTEISFQTFGDLRDLLGGMLNKYMNGRDVETAHALAQYWLAATNQVWPTHGIMGRTADELESFVRFVNRNGLTEALVGDEANANTLASVCMVHALVGGTGAFNIDPVNIQTLMGSWLGRDVDVSDVQDVEGMSALLYGKAAWGLYLPDVDNLTFLPIYMWQQKLPLPAFGGHNREVTDNALSELPSDMT